MRLLATSCTFFCRSPMPSEAAGAPAAAPADDAWTSDRPASGGPDGRGYDGPAGMDPEGVIDSNWDEVCENFDDMNLREELLRGIYAYGFEKPSAIQQRAIVPCVKGLDVIAQAQSGTGKTATFSISILQQIDTSLAQCQALILAPTRELAQQIQKVVMALGDYMGAQCHACIGGTSVREDMRKLDAGQHIVVGESLALLFHLRIIGISSPQLFISGLVVNGC